MNVPEKHNFLAGGGEMGELMRSIDWAATAVGPVSGWSPALRMMVDLLLRNRFPLILWWGPKFIQFYNDTYRPIPGDKHPKSMGQPSSECWKEIWHIIGPMIEAPFSGQPATTSDDLLLIIDRKGFMEETHFKVAYSPVPDETVQPTGVGGVLATVAEITEQVYGERQLRTLRELGARAAEAQTPGQACQTAALTLSENTYDAPFSLLYLVDHSGQEAHLAAGSGFDTIALANPDRINIDDQSLWPLKTAVQQAQTVVVTDLAEKFGNLPGGRWKKPPSEALLLPLASPDHSCPYGILIVGLSPLRELSDGYRTFFELAAGQVTIAIRNANAFQEERKRAEALAEIDRAKTVFFSNVSHEFRTPLTLMLGPVEDLLARSHTDLSPAAKGQLEVVNRNGMRLLRLVNTLLDFSRIESGRVQAVFEPTDLAAFTEELASVFRAATDRAGLNLKVNCPKLPEPVWVDRDMWEKIVLNLVSNAFKFTFEGEIEIKLFQGASSAVLKIRDTGVGIPEEEMPRLFERFHRVQNVRSRTYEGSGIGLSLVQELVKLHGGSIHAESHLGIGTTFIVTIPFGKEHLSPDCIGSSRTLASTAVGASSFVEEALRWLPEEPNVKVSTPQVLQYDLIPAPCPADEAEDTLGRPVILIADDNADMRQYLARLLAERYRVVTVPDGLAALNTAREKRPALILSDVMMPNMDGHSLVTEIRTDDALKTIPVILLSARAGEESRVEGLEYGADDYLIKPFSARELMARVAAHLDMARLRREATEQIRQSEERFRSVLDNSIDVIYRMNAQTGQFDYISPSSETVMGYTPEQYMALKSEDALAMIHPDDLPAMRTALTRLPETGSAEATYRQRTGSGEYRWISNHMSLARDSAGQPLYRNGNLRDITQLKQAEEALRQSEKRYRTLHETLRDPFAQVNMDGYIIDFNDLYSKMLGYTPEELRALTYQDLTPERWHAIEERILQEEIIPLGYSEVYEKEYRRKDGAVIPVELRNMLLRDDDGKPKAIWAIVRDITERKQAEEKLRESEERFRAVQDNSLDRFTILKPFYNDQGEIVDFTYVYQNALAAKTAGRSPEELVGHRMTEIFPTFPRTRFFAMYKQVVETGQLTEFEDRYDADGVEDWFRATVTPIPDGIAIATQIITERKKAEEALLESQKQLAADLNTLTLIQKISTSFEREGNLDLIQDEILSATVSIAGAQKGTLQLLRPESEVLDIVAQIGFEQSYIDFFSKVSYETAASCAAAFSQKKRVIVEDVESSPIFTGTPALEVQLSAGVRSVQSTPLFNRRGAIIGILSTHWDKPFCPDERVLGYIDLLARQAADIIERKTAEEALRKNERHALSLVAELKKADQNKNEFISVLSHELRNPMAAIVASLNLLEMTDNKEQTAKAKEILNRQMGHMCKLIDDLLDLTRITQNKIQLRKENILLNELVMHIAEDMKPEFKIAGVQLWKKVQIQPVFLYADPVRITQSIGNILKNALKYSKPDGNVWLTMKREKNGAVITVQDNGVGISPEILAHIFDPFIQADHSLHRQNSHGLGLGLSIVKGIVEMHGGKVTATSEGLGKGATFIICLPISIDDAGMKISNEEFKTERIYKILIIDDNKDLANILCSMINALGHQTFAAYCGLDGIEKSREIKPDVVFCDIGLPEISGYEVAKIIREDDRLKNVYLIALTGYAGESDIKQAKKNGFDRHLAKPVDISNLKQILSEVP